jgi:hypothetical protein
MNRLLEPLANPEFANKALFASTTEALALVLENDGSVKDVSLGLQRGQLNARDLAELVNSLLQTYRKGELFSGDIAMAALAVAMKNYFGDYSEQFLGELGNLSAAELPRSTRVAKFIQQTRSAVRYERKLLDFGAQLGAGSVAISAHIASRSDSIGYSCAARKLTTAGNQIERVA